MTELADGIWLMQNSCGDHLCVHVKGGKWSWYLSSDERLIGGGTVVDGSSLKPLRRIANLDGTPVVDEGVIEALVKTIQCVSMEATGTTLQAVQLTAILRKLLCPVKQEASEAEQADDAAICRLQFPDGSVPSDLLECAKGWKEAYDNAHSAFVSATEILKESRTQRDEALHLLKNLLAVVHRDGGHYADEHGLEKATADAMQLSSERIVAADEAQPHPTTSTYRENATGDEWLFLPENNCGRRFGLCMSSRRSDSFSRNEFGGMFTLQPQPADDAPIVRFEGAEHTPGPWHISPDDGVVCGMGAYLVVSEPTLRAEGEIIVAGVVGIDSNVYEGCGDDKANALLISAAPELLAACRATQDLLDELGWPNFMKDQAKSTIELIDAAIAKAEGATRPITLPPEQEALVKPIAAYFKVDESEARKALQGVGA